MSLFAKGNQHFASRGSIRDFETFAARNEINPQVAMKDTGQRSFKARFARARVGTPLLPGLFSRAPSAHG